MWHDPSNSFGQHEGQNFRYCSGSMREVFGGRDLLRRLARVFVIGVLGSSSLFYGVKFLMNNESEVWSWLDQHAGFYSKVMAPEDSHGGRSTRS